MGQVFSSLAASTLRFLSLREGSLFRRLGCFFRFSMVSDRGECRDMNNRQPPTPPGLDWPNGYELVDPFHDASHARHEPGRPTIRPLLYVRPMASEIPLHGGNLLRERGGRSATNGRVVDNVLQNVSIVPARLTDAPALRIRSELGAGTGTSSDPFSDCVSSYITRLARPAAQPPGRARHKPRVFARGGKQSFACTKLRKRARKRASMTLSTVQLRLVLLLTCPGTTIMWSDTLILAGRKICQWILDSPASTCSLSQAFCLEGQEALISSTLRKPTNDSSTR